MCGSFRVLSVSKGQTGDGNGSQMVIQCPKYNLLKDHILLEQYRFCNFLDTIIYQKNRSFKESVLGHPVGRQCSPLLPGLPFIPSLGKLTKMIFLCVYLLPWVCVCVSVSTCHAVFLKYFSIMYLVYVFNAINFNLTN